MRALGRVLASIHNTSRTALRILGLARAAAQSPGAHATSPCNDHQIEVDSGSIRVENGCWMGLVGECMETSLAVESAVVRTASGGRRLVRNMLYGALLMLAVAGVCQ